MVYSFYFSPTGGTKKVMDILTEGFMEAARANGVSEFRSVDFTVRSVYWEIQSLKEDDICFVGVPSYGGRVPRPALERLAEIRGRGAKAIAVVVYGNRAYDDTLLELKNQMNGCRFSVFAGSVAVAEHSILRQFAAGRPDAEDAKELKEFGAKIWERYAELSAPKTGEDGQKISSGRWPSVEVPGNEPYCEYEGASLFPSAGRKCNECGECVGECPAGAIPVETPKETNETMCIACMRCIDICPQKARGLNPMAKAAAGMKMKKVLQDRKGNGLFL